MSAVAIFVEVDSEEDETNLKKFVSEKGMINDCYRCKDGTTWYAVTLYNKSDAYELNEQMSCVDAVQLLWDWIESGVCNYDGSFTNPDDWEQLVI